MILFFPFRAFCLSSQSLLDHQIKIRTKLRLLTLFRPAPRFRSAQQKLLPAIMERLTAVICPSRSFNIFLSRCFSKKKKFLNWVLIHRFQPKCAKTVVALRARNIWYNSASHVIDFYYMCYCISF